MKKEYIILAVVVISLGIYLYFQNADSTHYTLPQPAVIKEADITKIEITKKDLSIVLNKKDDDWTIGNAGYPADSGKLIAIFDLLKEIKLTALISESGNYPRYELDDAGKITITAWNKDSVIRKLDIGKTASSYRHTFIKLDGNKNVYHAAKNLKSVVNTTEDKLVDKTILKFNSDSALSVDITDEKQQFSFVRKMDEIKVDVTKDKEADAAKTPAEPEEFWVSANGDKKEKESLETFIKAFSNLKCDGFVKGAKKEDFQNPVYSVSVKTDAVNTLSVFKSDDEKKFICTSSTSAFPFHLSSEKIDEFKELFTKI